MDLKARDSISLRSGAYVISDLTELHLLRAGKWFQLISISLGKKMIFRWLKNKRETKQYESLIYKALCSFAIFKYRDAYSVIIDEGDQEDDGEFDEDDEGSRSTQDRLLAELYVFRFWVAMFTLRMIRPDHLSDAWVLSRIIPLGSEFGRRYFEHAHGLDISNALGDEFSNIIDSRFYSYDELVIAKKERDGIAGSPDEALIRLLGDVSILAASRTSFGGTAAIFTSAVEQARSIINLKDW